MLVMLLNSVASTERSTNIDRAKHRKAHDDPRSVHEEPLLPGRRKSNQVLLHAVDEGFELYGSLQLLEERQWKMLVLPVFFQPSRKCIVRWWSGEASLGARGLEFR